ncbi:MAG: formate dehydrogenase subunit gamma [Sneathiella sp.]|nr:formate dehydrogenase subunit gamma [Sneathiella sp.]
MYDLPTDISDDRRPKHFLKMIWFICFLIFAAFFAFQHAAAQSQQKPLVLQGNVPGGTLGNTSDADYWRQLRQGAQGSVAGVNQQHGLLIQAEGNDWWQTRTQTVGKYVILSILGILVLLSLFFALRGRIQIDGGFSGKTILRFSLLERAGHWLLASSFIILALTGLNLLYGRQALIPLIGKQAFSDLAIFGKYIHSFVAFAFIAALIWVAVLWIAHNIPKREDVIWFLRGGGMFGKGHPSAYKFNAGQKVLFWLIILCGTSIALSGWALLYPFTTSMFSASFELSNAIFWTDFPTNLAAVQEQQYASLWHIIMAGVMIVIVLAHIYIGTIGMQGAISAMTSGEVDLNWAKEHHDLWVEEVENETPEKTQEHPTSQPAE